MSIKQLVTADDLLQMPENPGKRRELVNGAVIEMSPVIKRHGMIVTTLARLIDTHVARHDLGVVGSGDVGYVLQHDPDTVRAPDVSFVAWGNPAADPPERGYSIGAPTLAIEVVSPDDRASEVHAKVRQFLEAGSHQVWVLWPDLRSVTVHVRDGAAREFGPDTDLDGGSVLPGFSVRVSTLFDIRHRPNP